MQQGHPPKPGLKCQQKLAAGQKDGQPPSGGCGTKWPPRAPCIDSHAFSTAVSIALSGPLAGGVAIAGGRIYTMWVEEVNKEGGIYVKEYGKKMPIERIDTKLFPIL